MPRAAALTLPLLAGLALAACGSGDQSSSPTANAAHTLNPAAHPSPAGLPFHYEAQGESSGPSFHVPSTGTYAVSYELKGSAQQPGCNVTIALVADDGSSHVVVPGVVLQPSDDRKGDLQVQLAAGNWRFQEGGGCSWSVNVALPS
jgi:hypothetical protein